MWRLLGTLATTVAVFGGAGLGCADESAPAETGAGGAGGSGGAGPGIPCAASQPPRGPSAIYLAFEGATLESVPDGSDDATAWAFSLVSETTVYPPFLANDPDRQLVIDTLVSDMASVLAPFAVTVTTERPSGDHMAIVFAGQDAGALLGLVRLDCGDVVRNDVAVMFEGVAAPERGRYAIANETLFAVARSIGLAKSSGPGHPCSCDPSGTCENDELCQLTANATVSFSACPGTGAEQDEITAFADVFGCASP